MGGGPVARENAEIDPDLGWTPPEGGMLSAIKNRKILMDFRRNLVKEIIQKNYSLVIGLVI